MSAYSPFSEENTELDATNITQETVNDSSGGVSLSGKYHFQVQELKWENLEQEGDAIKIPSVTLVMRVMEGENPSEKDKVHYHRVRLMNPENWADFRAGDDGSPAKGGPLKPLDDRDKKGILALYYAFGVVGDDVFGKKTRMSKDLFDAMTDTHAICEVTEYVSKRNNKIYHEIKSHNCWRVDDPRVAKVPKDVEVLQMSGISLAESNGQDVPDLDGV